jgi:hypothetical protein
MRSEDIYMFKMLEIQLTSPLCSCRNAAGGHTLNWNIVTKSAYASAFEGNAELQVHCKTCNTVLTVPLSAVKALIRTDAQPDPATPEKTAAASDGGLKN